MLWMLYGVIGFFTAILLYPMLRLYVGISISVILTLLGITATFWLSSYYIVPYFIAWQYERNIRLNYPIVDYAAAQSPNEYHEYISQVREHVLHFEDLNVNNEVDYESDFVYDLLVKYGAYASSDSIYNYLQQNVAYDKQLIKIDPLFVLYHQFPDKFSGLDVNFSKLNRQEYLSNLFSSAENVIKSGLENPLPLPTQDDIDKAKKIFQEVMGDLTKKYGEKAVSAVFQNPQDSSLDIKKSAEIVIAFYEGILARGKEDAVLFMRVTMMLNMPAK